MDDETTRAFQTLKEDNEALIIGLEGAIYYLENWGELTPEGRKSVIDKLTMLIAQSNKFYGTEPTEH